MSFTVMSEPSHGNEAMEKLNAVDGVVLYGRRQTSFMTGFLLYSIATGVVMFGPLVDAVRGQSAPEPLLYQTGFEFTEGFDPGFTLINQGGWVGTDDGGNGLVSGFFEGTGQHAFIGFAPPDDRTAEFVSFWRPLNFTPTGLSGSIVQFSTRMQIVASTNGHADDFRWSVYNSAGSRFFSVDFDTSNLQVSYSLDKPTDFIPTQIGFDTFGSYDLQVWMDFGRNQWSAWLNDSVIINSQPVSAAGAALDLGDFDAVWALRQAGMPGDNFMVFDDYRVAVEPIAAIPVRLESLGFAINGVFLLRVYAQAGLNYTLEATEDWLHWRTLKSFTAPADGVFDFEDAEALSISNRFFRVLQQR